MKRRILVVEDDDDNRQILSDLLAHAGYEVFSTDDGIEALRLRRRHDPDLILIDIQLPYVSGLEVTKWLKEDRDSRFIPIIAVTGFAMSGDREIILKFCDAYISKPFSGRDLLQVIKGLLGTVTL